MTSRTTLLDLHYAAASDPSVSFSRVIVEMSGLGDPAPLVNAMPANRNDSFSQYHQRAGKAFYIGGFVTLFDMVSGMLSIEDHFEVLKQVAFADRIVLTKTDLLSDQTKQSHIAEVSKELRSINSSAEILARHDIDLNALFSPRPYSSRESR